MASVRVAVRVRPLNQREIGKGSPVIICMEGKKTKITNRKIVVEGESDIRSSEGRERVKEFVFDYSYDSMDSAQPNFASQQQVFSDLGTEVVQSSFEGYNACVFAYGQTGSGKSYTMMGDGDNPGLIPRICKGLFNKMNTGLRDGAASYRVEVSYLEIYNERVRDLLKASKAGINAHALRVREHPKNGPYVQDLSKHIVMDYGDIQALMDKGNANRTTASTNMNDTSSRSHAIFTISFTQAKLEDGMPSEVTSKVNLVDLAGSERASKTGAQGDTLREGANINKSLVTLGNVISALADACDSRRASASPGATSASAAASKKMVFIPYRDSVLTWLLKDSLGGNSRTIMVATISPAEDNYGETLSTLRYANRAKNILNKPVINEDTNVKLIRELRAEIVRLKNLLGNVDVVLDPAIQERIHENEAKAKVLTAEWTEKWQATQSLLRERKDLRIQREKGGKGVVLDSELPHLIGLNDDMLSTGITLYHLKEGATHIGAASLTLAAVSSPDEEGAGDGDVDESPNDERPQLAQQTPVDIVLHGPEIYPLHCTIHYNVKANGQVTLTPARLEASCCVNGTPVHGTVRLMQGAVILLGSTSMFRFNHPAEAARLRAAVATSSPERGKSGGVPQSFLRLREAATGFLSKSMSDLARINETIYHRPNDDSAVSDDHSSPPSPVEEDNNNVDENDEKKLLEQKRRELDELRAELERTEAERLQEVRRKEWELEQKRIVLEKLNEDVALAQKKVLDEESRLKIPSPEGSSDEGAEIDDAARYSLERRQSNLKHVIEDSLHDLARKEEAHINATLTAKSSITNELENFSERVAGQRSVMLLEWERLEEAASKQRHRLASIEDSLNQRRDALQWERDEELANLEREEAGLSDLKAELARILEEQERTQEPTEERIDRESKALLEANAKLMEMEAELIDSRSAEEVDIVKRKDQLEDDLRKEWEELEESSYKVREREEKMNQLLGACASEKDKAKIMEIEGKEIGDDKRRIQDEEEKLMAIAAEVEAMFEEEVTQMEEKADIKRKVLEKERERIKSMEKRSLHYVQKKIQEKTTWIDERKAKAEDQQRLLADLTKSSDTERMEAELAKQAVYDEKVALLHSALKEHQEATKALEDIDKCKSVMMKNMQSEIDTIDLQRKRLLGQVSPSPPLDCADDAATFKTLEQECVFDAAELELAQRKLLEASDEVERVNFDLSQIDDAERLNLLVNQEVDRRLFEEKLFREKRMETERQEERRRGHAELERMRRMHAREVELLKRRLKAAHEENSNLVLEGQTRANPYGRAFSQDSTVSRDDKTNYRGFSRPRSPGAGYYLGNQIEISIPSFVLRGGGGGDEHYAFEMRIVVGEEAWTLFRRYSRFREFHMSLKRIYPEVAALSFPPKKFFSSKNERFVAERRQALEEYMRRVLEILTTTAGYPLALCDGHPVTKKAFSDFSPFFRKGIFETTKHATS